MRIRHSEQLLQLQTEVLEAVASGATLAAIGLLICRRAEAHAPGAVCSLLLVADAALHPLAGPSLPQSYTDVLDGLAIGPVAGSCGTAAYLGTPVEVTDIATDPLWHDYKALALPLGLKACWSSPVLDRAGVVRATFAFYFPETRGPTAFERQIVQTCLHLCALAIEHEQVRATDHRRAYVDALTGLPNRPRFNQTLGDAVAAAGPFGLLLLDIADLRQVNDAMGHAAGDAVITTVGCRAAGAGPDFEPFRLAGDEFAVLVRNCVTPGELDQASVRLLAAVNGEVSIGAHSVPVHVTLGGAHFPVDGMSADALYQNADMALSSAKQNHRGGYLRFSPDLRTRIIRRIQQVRRFDTALAEDRVLAHYQPIVRLDTGEIVGLEALARVRLPEGGVVSVADYAAALEDPRLAWELTGRMLSCVADDVRHWLDLGIPFQHVGVNVTTGDFSRGDVVERLEAIFGQAGVPLRHVLLEVNEAVLMGGTDGIVPRTLAALRARGLLVALDDFGTGFASLTHVLSFPVDVIKIDRSFVDGLVTDPRSMVVVRAVLEIARQLGLRVVAEGIETAEQADLLRDLGCFLGQGYFFSRPVPPADTTELLQLFAQQPAPASRRRSA